MKSTSFNLILLTSLTTTTFAASIQSRASVCHPNFSGRSVSILAPSGAVEWGKGSLENLTPLTYDLPSNEIGEFKVQFTGFADNSYYIKAADVPANNFWVNSEAPRGNVVEWTTVPSPHWNITCTSCSTNDAYSSHGVYASGCAIHRVESNLCVAEYSDSIPGAGLREFPCEEGEGVWNGKEWQFVLP